MEKSYIKERRECKLSVSTIKLPYLSFCCPSKLPSLVNDGSPKPFSRGGHEVHSLHAISLSEAQYQRSCKTALSTPTPFNISHVQYLRRTPSKKSHYLLKHSTREKTTNKPDFTGYKLGRNSPGRSQTRKVPSRE